MVRLEYRRVPLSTVGSQNAETSVNATRNIASGRQTLVYVTFGELPFPIGTECTKRYKYYGFRAICQTVCVCVAGVPLPNSRYQNKFACSPRQDRSFAYILQNASKHMVFYNCWSSFSFILKLLKNTNENKQKLSLRVPPLHSEPKMLDIYIFVT